ncbi:hypothetical protein SAICODRAFT_28341 [Saitoella complicata NRRL Y-17804]|nr:uncharacterized protein SAICODRAFT_28341 [Saitoella complicata NRRL Y-17804]ODQ56025.1 hypothetical protein SAICODRAFT_28341 [Saitoella complicata NRRL Y-17804]
MSAQVEEQPVVAAPVVFEEPVAPVEEVVAVVEEPVVPIALPESTDAAPVVEPATEAQAEAVEPLNAEAVAPVVAKEAAPVAASEEVVDPTEAMAGETIEMAGGWVSYKTSGFIPHMNKRWFYFRDEAYPLGDLNRYLRKNEKKTSILFDPKHQHGKTGSDELKSTVMPQDPNKHVYDNLAHAAVTGKGLLFWSKIKSDTSSPSGIINLADISEVHHEGLTTDRLVLKLAYEKEYHLQVAIPAERHSWIETIKKKVGEAKAARDEVQASFIYKQVLSKLENHTAFKPAANPAAPSGAEEVFSDDEEEAPDAPAIDAIAAPAATEAAPSSPEDKKKLKRGSSILEKLPFMHHKHHEEKKEVAETEQPATVAEETEIAPVDAAEAVETPATEEPVAVRSVEPTAEVAAEAAAVEEPVVEARPTVKEGRRQSFFGKMFNKKEKPEAAPVAEVAPVEEAVAPVEGPALEAVIVAEQTTIVAATTEPVAEAAPVAAEPVTEEKIVAPTPKRSKSPFRFFKRVLSPSKHQDAEPEAAITEVVAIEQTIIVAAQQQLPEIPDVSSPIDVQAPAEALIIAESTTLVAAATTEAPVVQESSEPAESSPSSSPKNRRLSMNFFKRNKSSETAPHVEPITEAVVVEETNVVAAVVPAAEAAPVEAAAPEAEATPTVEVAGEPKAEAKEKKEESVLGKVTSLFRSASKKAKGSKKEKPVEELKTETVKEEQVAEETTEAEAAPALPVLNEPVVEQATVAELVSQLPVVDAPVEAAAVAEVVKTAPKAVEATA